MTTTTLPTTLPTWLPGRLTLDTGTAGDYRELARWHYRAGRPATWAAIVAIRHELNDSASRRGRACFSGRVCPAHVKEDARSLVAAVGVLSWPTACSRPRSKVFHLDGATYGQRIKWANANLRTISRVIVRPSYRGAGLAGVIIAALIERCSTPYIEATAAMAACHPMFEHAGMNRHDEPGYPPYFWRGREL